MERSALKAKRAAVLQGVIDVLTAVVSTTPSPVTLPAPGRCVAPLLLVEAPGSGGRPVSSHHFRVLHKMPMGSNPTSSSMKIDTSMKLDTSMKITTLLVPSPKGPKAPMEPLDQLLRALTSSHSQPAARSYSPTPSILPPHGISLSVSPSSFNTVLRPVSQGSIRLKEGSSLHGSATPLNRRGSRGLVGQAVKLGNRETSPRSPRRRSPKKS